MVRKKDLTHVRESDFLVTSKESFKEKLKQLINQGLDTKQQIVANKLEEFNKQFAIWNDYTSEYLKQSFNNEDNQYKREYDQVNFFTATYRVPGFKPDPILLAAKKISNKIEFLESLLAKADLLKAENVVQTTNIQVKPKMKGENIFIVHGHNHEIQQKVARTIERLGLNPIILGEQANSGATIIEKFEKYSDVGFAIILLTADDLGKAKNEAELLPRARQNVILELGYFIGRLGRGHILPLYESGVEKPGDIDGVVYTLIDTGEKWKFEIVKELKAVGFDVDANKIL